MSSLSVKDHFFAPNDDVWARSYDGEFNRFHGGDWQAFGVSKKTRDPAERRFRWGLRLLSGGTPPWLYFDSREHEMVRFDPGGGKKAPSELPVDLGWEGNNLAVRVGAFVPDEDR